MVFHQASPPPRWTITADNDKLLRIATTVGADGGANSITASVTSGAGSAHSHAGSSNHPDHTHTVPNAEVIPIAGSGANSPQNNPQTTSGASATLSHDATGSESAHTHAVDMDFAYTDAIIASKD